MTPPAFPPINTDEARAGTPALPDLLRCEDGRPVAAAAGWPRRRAELHHLLAEHVFGHPPPATRFVVEDLVERDHALGGLSRRLEVTLRPVDLDTPRRIRLLVHVPRCPAGDGRPGPVFLGLNFRGNHATTREPDVALCVNWLDDGGGVGRGPPDRRADEASRGGEAGRWPWELVLARGCAVATCHHGDLFDDRPDGWEASILPVLAARGGVAPEARGPADAGAIGAWAWTLSRVRDVLASLPGLDGRPVVVVGHSRLGKAALWAAACDARFDGVIANNSGKGGASLLKRRFGETVERLNAVFPHWFCRRFHAYGGCEEALPVDAHALLALAAPRPLHLAWATEDLWADPRGEHRAACEAWRVYRLLGAVAGEAPAFPEPGAGADGRVGWHLRAGPHDVTPADWLQFLAFAERHVAG